MISPLTIDTLPIDQLVPYARNARTHSDKQVAQIARSIHRFGFINPIIVDKAGMVIAGHGRVLAAKQLGLAVVPVIQVDHLSEAEKRAYILADNKIAENAGWDPDLLRVELEYLTQIDIDVDVDLTGFRCPRSISSSPPMTLTRTAMTAWTPCPRCPKRALWSPDPEICGSWVPTGSCAAIAAMPLRWVNSWATSRPGW